MVDYDAVIVGAGIAGMTCAIYLEQAGFEVLLIGDHTESALCSASEVNNFPGQRGKSGFEIVEEIASQLKKEETFTKAEQLSVCNDGYFLIRDERDVYQTKNVVIATGSRPKIPNIIGLESLVGNGVSTCAYCDGPLCKGEKVAVIGGGESAISSAIYLSRIANSVDVLCRKQQTSTIESLQRVSYHHNINLKFGIELDEVRQEIGRIGGYINGIRYDSYDRIFLCTGRSMNSELIKEHCLCSEDGGVITEFGNRSSYQGLYACGDVNASNIFKQAVTASADGASTALQIIKNSKRV